MKISAINSYNSYNKTNFQGKICQKFLSADKKKKEINDNQDFFVKNRSLADNIFGFFTKKKTKPKNAAVESFLERTDKFQIRDYLKIKPEDIYDIKQNADLRCYYFANLNANFAKGIKELLDNKYGEDGYVFVSIGTSPSLIARTLEHMGVETKYVPISKLGSEFFDADEFLQRPIFEKYAKFLEEQGISKETLKKRNKKFIFYDYTNSGKSLKIFERIMREKFELPDDKIEFRSLDKDLRDKFANKIFIDDKDAVEEYREELLFQGEAETYSCIRHLPATRIGIANYDHATLTKYDEKAPRFFDFLTIDILNSQGLLSFNPLNKNSL